MDNGMIIFGVFFGALGYLLAGASYFSRKGLIEKQEKLRSALSVLESRLADPQALVQPKPAPGAKAKVKKEPKHQDEIVALRKETAHQRDLLQELRLESKEFGQKLKDALHAKEVEIFQVKKDNEQLLSLLREKENPGKSKAATEQDPKLPGPSQLASSAEFNEIKRKLASLERHLKTERDQGDKLKVEKQSLQHELRRWTDAVQDSEGKPLDPSLFRKWKERALTARVQYQMMKQLREMSDIKLSTYQESVVRLAKFVFDATGQQAPMVQNGENASDRYLAQALVALSAKGGRGTEKGLAIIRQSDSSENSVSQY